SPRSSAVAERLGEDPETKCSPPHSFSPTETNHLFHDSLRFANVLQHPTGMRRVESAAFVFLQRQSGRVAAPPLDQVLFRRRPFLAPRLCELLCVTLNTDHSSIRVHGPRNGSRELPEA